MDSIDHELVHALIDDSEGLRDSKFYSGPDDSEVKENTIRLLKREEHRNNLLKAYLNADIFTVGCGDLDDLVMKDFPDVPDRYKEYES